MSDEAQGSEVSTPVPSARDAVSRALARTDSQPATDRGQRAEPRAEPRNEANENGRDRSDRMERERKASHRGNLEKIYEGGASVSAADRAISGEAREAIQTLKGAFPGMPLGKLAAMVEEWEGHFQRDPYSAAESLKRWAARHFRQLPQKEKPAAKEEGKRESFAETFNRHAESASDADELAAFIPKYGANLTDILKRTANVINGLSKSPGFADTLPVLYGGPATQGEMNEQWGEAEQIVGYEKTVKNLENTALTHFPALRDKGVYNAVCQVLRLPDFHRTGNHAVDLKRAYSAAMELAHASRSKKQREAIAEKAKLSITGSPSGGSAPGQRGIPKSAREALSNAFGAMR